MANPDWDKGLSSLTSNCERHGSGRSRSSPTYLINRKGLGGVLPRVLLLLPAATEPRSAALFRNGLWVS